MNHSITLVCANQPKPNLCLLFGNIVTNESALIKANCMHAKFLKEGKSVDVIAEMNYAKLLANKCVLQSVIYG